MKFYKKLEKHLQQVLKIKTTPHEIALGFSLGALIAILPTFGLGVFIGLGLLLIFKKISKISMMIAFIVFNPLVLLLTYSLSFTLGKLLFRGASPTVFANHYLNQIYSFARVFLLGNFIVAISISLLCYIFVFYLSRWYQRTHPIDKIEDFIRDEINIIKEELNLNNFNS